MSLLLKSACCEKDSVCVVGQRGEKEVFTPVETLIAESDLELRIPTDRYVGVAYLWGWGGGCGL